MPIESAEALRALYGEVVGPAKTKQIDHLDEHCARIIAMSPFLVLSTSDGRRQDASPKGDEPGFVQISEDGNLLIPDWPGNRRIDGLSNIIKNPWAGVLFIIPGLRETLRVNGAASIHDEPEFLHRFERRGKHPITVLQIKPEEVFMHCAKAFMRSKLWQPESWPEKGTLPRMIEIIKAHAGTSSYADQAAMEERLNATLY